MKLINGAYGAPGRLACTTVDGWRRSLSPGRSTRSRPSTRSKWLAVAVIEVIFGALFDAAGCIPALSLAVVRLCAPYWTPARAALRNRNRDIERATRFHHPQEHHQHQRQAERELPTPGRAIAAPSAGPDPIVRLGF